MSSSWPGGRLPSDVVVHQLVPLLDFCDSIIPLARTCLAWHVALLQSEPVWRVLADSWSARQVPCIVAFKEIAHILLVGTYQEKQESIRCHVKEWNRLLVVAAPGQQGVQAVARPDFGMPNQLFLSGSGAATAAFSSPCNLELQSHTTTLTVSAWCGMQFTPPALEQFRRATLIILPASSTNASVSCAKFRVLAQAGAFRGLRVVTLEHVVRLHRFWKISCVVLFLAGLVQSAPLVFLSLLAARLDIGTNSNSDWWAVFSPLWLALLALVCCAKYAGKHQPNPMMLMFTRPWSAGLSLLTWTPMMSSRRRNCLLLLCLVELLICQLAVLDLVPILAPILLLIFVLPLVCCCTLLATDRRICGCQAIVSMVALVFIEAALLLVLDKQALTGNGDFSWFIALSPLALLCFLLLGWACIFIYCRCSTRHYRGQCVYPLVMWPLCTLLGTLFFAGLGYKLDHATVWLSYTALMLLLQVCGLLILVPTMLWRLRALSNLLEHTLDISNIPTPWQTALESLSDYQRGQVLNQCRSLSLNTRLGLASANEQPCPVWQMWIDYQNTQQQALFTNPIL